MNRTYWKSLLPAWPVVPPRLWLTAGVAGLACLSLGFEQELWSRHPAAWRGSVAVLVVSFLAGMFQVDGLLWRWADAYPGPRWIRFLLRLALALPRALGIMGIAILALLAPFVLLFLLS